MNESQELKERIHQRANELDLARGREDGHDIEDWLLAKEEIAEQEVRPIAA